MSILAAPLSDLIYSHLSWWLFGLSLAVGLVPLAVKIGTGGEAYVPMARAIVGGMLLSVITGVYAIPALWYLVQGRRPVRRAEA